MQEGRIDGVRQRRLPIEDVASRLLERSARTPPPLDADHRIERAVTDRDRRERRGEVDLEALHGGNEARQGDDRSRAGTPAAQAERVAHHRALREAAEHRPAGGDARLLGQPVQPLARETIRGQERVGVGIADLAYRVPMRASGREVERTARRDAEQPSLRVEHVEQREEVVLVGAAPVEEDEHVVVEDGA